MKRLYTVKEFNDFINFALETVPGICLGTDVIVGFPDETEEEFQNTYDYLRDSALHYFHVFSYSDRDHAQSRKLENKVTLQAIQSRSRTLRELSERKRNLFYASFKGQTTDVLFEHEKDGQWNGLTDNFIRVTVQSPDVLTNQIRMVKFTDPADEEMRAVLV
jgi:threonylcarbamoyladenosine tRNA methylthiotransferase MtaB